MTIEYVPEKLTPERVEKLWDGYEAGRRSRSWARRFDKHRDAMDMFALDGSVPGSSGVEGGCALRTSMGALESVAEYVDRDAPRAPVPGTVLSDTGLEW
jgi:hypothetical protein